ncbi:MAG TPA: hypothetical protein VK963_04595 [Candidatus Saccharimonadales bacterium]|nr:hypothetical protein [Candidatus Saccharimonadales bacterium]
MPEGNDKDLYYVAVKLFLLDDGKLLITYDIFGPWDLPGGQRALMRLRPSLSENHAQIAKDYFKSENTIQ